MIHKTVLLQEAVEALNVTPDATIVDTTFGAGGHAKEIVKLLGARGRFIGIDADATAFREVEFGDARPQVDLVVENFRNLTNILRSLHIEKVNGILADLGWRMDQFADGSRGFSFREEGPLSMTYGDETTTPFTAHEIVNEWDEPVLANIIYGYGEERFARKIAKAIVTARSHTPITTTTELAKLITDTIPKRFQNPRLHPATKTFQALRIAVNDELSALEVFIPSAFTALSPGGRLVIITFHSLEDRIVKQTFRSLATSTEARVITKKPIIPSDEEISDNPRARSAKLRIIEKTT